MPSVRKVEEGNCYRERRAPVAVPPLQLVPLRRARNISAKGDIITVSCRTHEVARITFAAEKVAPWPSNLRKQTCNWCGLGPLSCPGMSRTSVLALSFFRGKTSVPAEDPNDATFTDLFAEAEPGGEEAAPTEGEPDAEMDPS